MSKANARSSAWALFICRRSTPQTTLSTRCQHSIDQRKAYHRTKRRAILRVWTGHVLRSSHSMGSSTSAGAPTSRAKTA
jgi:hypothetical protein